MENPPIISHVSLGTNDFAKVRAFYTAVLATVGAGIVMEHGATGKGEPFARRIWRTLLWLFPARPGRSQDRGRVLGHGTGSKPEQ